MPKSVFWPATLVIMGLIFIASNMGYLPAAFWNLWPLILIVVGLGGLVTSDREEWIVEPKKKSTKKSSRSRSTTKKKTTKKATSKKTASKKKSSTKKRSTKK